MRYFIVLFFLLFSLHSMAKKQNEEDGPLDSIIKLSNKYENVEEKIDFFVKQSRDTSNKKIVIDLLEEAKTYTAAYGLPMNDSIYQYLGKYYTEQFMFPQAISVYDSLSQYFKRKSDTVNWVKSMDKLARNYLRAGLTDSALDTYMQSLDLVDSFNDPSLKFMANHHLAHFYLVATNSLVLADKYIKECRKLVDELDDDSLRLEYYLEQAMIFVYNESYDSAEVFYNKSAALIDSMGFYEDIDKFYNSMAVFNQVKENNDEALKYYKLAYELNYEKKNYVGLYVNCYNIFTFYMGLEDYENAEKYLLLSLEYADKNNIRQYKIATYQQLHQFYSETGNYEKAYEYLLSMNEMAQSMHFSELSSKVADLTIKYDVLKTRDELKLVTQKNEIQSLKLRNDKFLIFGLIVLVIGVAIYFVLLNRQNRIKTKQKTDQLILKNLMQQMNPHFIFNTLNSIQYYIYNHSELDTNDYISKFATLIRRILDNSHKNSVSLGDEIETLKLYIQLEQIRFNENFDYDVQMQEDIDPEEYHIPSMFIQPFIENAIVHGLRHIQEKGHLKISFAVNGGIMECSVKDNGIGRQKAEELKAQKAHKHESKALTIAYERLKLLSNIHNKKLSIHYIDIPQEEGGGTIVHIQLPIIKS